MKIIELFHAFGCCVCIYRINTVSNSDPLGPHGHLKPRIRSVVGQLLCFGGLRWISAIAETIRMGHSSFHCKYREERNHKWKIIIHKCATFATFCSLSWFFFFSFFFCVWFLMLSRLTNATFGNKHLCSMFGFPLTTNERLSLVLNMQHENSNHKRSRQKKSRSGWSDVN